MTETIHMGEELHRKAKLLNHQIRRLDRAYRAIGLDYEDHDRRGRVLAMQREKREYLSMIFEVYL